MSRRPRRNHSPAFKAKVALEAVRGEQPIIAIAERFDVHPGVITTWKRQLLEGKLMAAIDEVHTELPFYGIRRLRGELLARGFAVGRQRVATLMRRMGITAIAPRRRLSKPAPGHKIYPYLLRGLEICEAGHVWATDVTYLPMRRGFCYLTAVMDWASRRVLSWRLSTTLDAAFCIEGGGALRRAAGLQHRQ